MSRTRPVVLSVVCALAIAGCAAQDLAKLQQARNEAGSILQQAQSAHDQIRQQLSVLPANDPVRQRLEPQLTRLDQIITKAQSYLPVLDGAIASAKSGQIDPSLQQAVGVIPYGSLILAAVAGIFGIVKHIQAGNVLAQHQQTQKAFQQVVSALDAALPNPTPDQQAKVDAVLDSDVKAKVAAARSA